jgi:uncharacterized protein (DUF2141 family)
MLKYIIYFITLLSLLSANKTGDLLINVTNIRNNNGLIAYIIFDSQAGWPNNIQEAYTLGTSNISEGNCTIAIMDIPYGKYAISILHDENNNQKLDKNFLGIPQEGIGASNNNYRRYGAPLYEESLINIVSKNNYQVIKLKYY